MNTVVYIKAIKTIWLLLAYTEEQGLRSIHFVTNTTYYHTVHNKLHQPTPSMLRVRSS